MLWKPSISPSDVIRHSAKGTEWEEHKYLKKEGNKYFYSENYEGGRHVNGPADKETKEDGSSSNLKRWSEGDSDFDDKNYSPKNLLGDTNFYGFKTKDGRTVIIQEDVKWELPAGKKIDKKLVERLEAFDKEIERRRNAGEKVGSDEWEKLASQAINGSGAKKTSSKKRSSGSKSSKSAKDSKGSSSKLKEMSEKERRAKNKQTMKARSEEQQKNKEKRMKRNRLNGKEYLNHSFWAPTEDYLMHHGVDGQEWGVKNGPPYPLERGYKTSGKRKYRTDKGYDQKNQNGSKKRKTSQMSNEDLKRQIDRKELEQRYNDLSDAQISRGRQKVMGIVRDYATVAAAVLTTAKLIETGRKILMK